MTDADAAAVVKAYDAREEMAGWDQELFMLSIFAFLGLILVIFLLFTSIGSLGTTSATFQLGVTNGINEIQALLPPAQKAANAVLSKLFALGENIFDTITYAITQGLAAVLNVIVAIGDSLIATVAIGLGVVIDALEAAASGLISFFEAVFTPVADVIEQQSQTVILFTGFMAASISPILNIIAVILRAIERIGSVF